MSQPTNGWKRWHWGWSIRLCRAHAFEKRDDGAIASACGLWYHANVRHLIHWEPPPSKLRCAKCQRMAPDAS